MSEMDKKISDASPPSEGVKVTDEMLEAMARAHDKEEAAQMGEPSPWDVHGGDLDPDWVDGRRVAMRCAFAALQSQEPK